MRNLYHILVTQDHLDAGPERHLAEPRRQRGGHPSREAVLSRAALDALRAEGEPVAAVYAGSAVTTVVVEDGQELAYYWCNDGITLMSACDLGRAAELEPQTVRLMDLPTYDAYCSSHPSSD